MTEQGDASSPVVAMSGVDVRFGSRGQVAALKQVDLEVSRQTVLGVIGESGSGKTTLIRSMLGVVRPKAGTVNLNGHDLYSLSETQRFRVVAKEASLIFQDPRSSLNQRLSVGAIVGEPLKLHTSLSRAERRSKIGSLLDESVGAGAGGKSDFGRPGTSGSAFPILERCGTFSLQFSSRH